MKKLTALIVLDGFGHSKDVFGNAIMAADISYIPSAGQLPQHAYSCFGVDVGLPEGQMGTRGRAYELGAGRIAPQELLFKTSILRKAHSSQTRRS